MDPRDPWRNALKVYLLKKHKLDQGVKIRVNVPIENDRPYRARDHWVEQVLSVLTWLMLWSRQPPGDDH